MRSRAPRGSARSFVRYDFSFDPLEECEAKTGVDALNKFLYEDEPDFEKFKSLLPQPLVEIHRAAAILDLRHTYTENVRTHLKQKPPKDSLNRWFFEQLTASAKDAEDPFLRNMRSLEINHDVITRELLLAIPYRPSSRHKNTEDALTDLSIYIAALKRMLARTKRPDFSEEAKCVTSELRAHVAECEKLIKNAQRALCLVPDVTLEDIEKVINGMQRVAYRYLKVFMGKNVERVVDVVTESAVSGSEQVRKIAESIRMGEITTRVELRINSQATEVRISPEVTPRPSIQKMALAPVIVSAEHFSKLRELYAHASKRHDPDAKMFIPAAFCLLLRYRTFFGEEREGASFHAAAPGSVFDHLRRTLGVCQELFASPLNCYFRRFCSAFPDTDIFFGSRGSFNDFDVLRGAFEVGPPYTEEVMDRMADRLEVLLARAEKHGAELCFVVFVPEWRHPPCHALTVMDQSRFLRDVITASGKEHFYIVGDQHLRKATALQKKVGQRDEKLYKVPHGTVIYVLMTPAFFERKISATPTNLGQVLRTVSTLLEAPHQHGD